MVDLDAPPDIAGDATDSGGETLAQVAVRLLRGFPRPIQQAQLAGFLAYCRAHPLASAALDYATRRAEQAERAEQRQEREFWGQVRGILTDLSPAAPGADAAGDRSAGRLATTLAQHLAAENLLRLAQLDAGPRTAAPRIGAGQRPAAAARTGGQRD